MSNRKKLAGPGLQGNYSGTCIVCLQPTDTGLAFRGDAEWLIAGLVTLGLPQDQAYSVYRQNQAMKGADLDPGNVRDGTHDLAIRVCAECVRECPAGFPEPRPGRPRDHPADHQPALKQPRRIRSRFRVTPAANGPGTRIIRLMNASPGANALPLSLSKTSEAPGPGGRRPGAVTFCLRYLRRCCERNPG